jgi:acyl-coenzyme A synthetase/AMP-(fatty) acid ligase
MSHFHKKALEKPEKFNFATDVIDYWASTQPHSPAMHWVSQDLSEYHILPYRHFERHSHRIAVLFESLGLTAGQRIVMILPRIPEW